MSCENKYNFNKIQVPDKLDVIVKDTIKKARYDKNKKHRITNLIKFSSAIASIFFAFIVGINISPVFANATENIPVISSISKALLFHYDKNIINSDKQHIGNTQTDKNIGITVDNVISDNSRLFILYTLNGQFDKKDLKDLLLENFILKDNSNNILLSSKDFNSPILPPELDNKPGDYIILSNKKYKCIVSSLGNSIDSYTKDKKTYGSLELISESDSSNIPNGITFDISSITEAYNTKQSNQNSSGFISKFNRAPVSIQGLWSFNIGISNKLKLVKPKTYTNIDFTTNNTNFTLEYLKIYPTHIDTRIELGQNKLDKSQCWSIGRVIAANQSKLPYLIDEKGNKYFILKNAFTNIDSNKCIDLSFESCYFNKSKELYLVINQLNYSPGAPFVNIEPIKVKIK